MNFLLRQTKLSPSPVTLLSGCHFAQDEDSIGHDGLASTGCSDLKTSHKGPGQRNLKRMFRREEKYTSWNVTSATMANIRRLQHVVRTSEQISSLGVAFQALCTNLDNKGVGVFPI